MTGRLDYKTEDAVALLALCHPSRRNAINLAMWQAFVSAMARAQRDKTILAIIIYGAGKHFCAGADITEFEAISKSKLRSAQYSKAIRDGLHAIETCTKPVLAAIEGDCMGGGVSVAVACDYVVAGAGARFAIPAARLGLLYPPDDTRRLLARLGPSRTKDLLWRPTPLTARTASQWGLVDACVGRARALPFAKRYCADMATLSQWSIRGSKRMLSLLAQPLTAAHKRELARLAADTFRHADFRAGYRAFLGKAIAKFPFR